MNNQTNIEALVSAWFDKWLEGDFLHLPITKNFTHTSPFGTIEGRKAYIDLVQNNKDKFLGYTFEIHDAIYDNDRACVRYTARQGDDFRLDVSEWYYTEENLIRAIIAHYHIGEIRQDRQLDE